MFLILVKDLCGGLGRVEGGVKKQFLSLHPIGELHFALSQRGRPCSSSRRPGIRWKLKGKHYSKEWDEKCPNTERRASPGIRGKILLWIPRLGNTSIEGERGREMPPCYDFTTPLSFIFRDNRSAAQFPITFFYFGKFIFSRRLYVYTLGFNSRDIEANRIECVWLGWFVLVSHFVYSCTLFKKLLKKEVSNRE